MSVYDGKHLLVDTKCTNHKALVELMIGQSCLTQIAESAGMTMVLPPVGVRFPHAASEMHRVLASLKAEGLQDSQTARVLADQLDSRENKEFGYSTFALIAESHLSLHTFPEAGFFTFDFYSCTGFDHERALAILDEVFAMNVTRKVQVIDRAIDLNA
ncbi:MAG: S-adenosylmethionine decarboxylase [Bradymonadia bacterium]